MVKNLPKLMADNKLHIWQGQRPQGRMSTKKSATQYIIFNFRKLKRKKKK